MKIVIYNDELRSGMQMYLTLSNRHDVVIAQDVKDLFDVLEESRADLTFVDLAVTQTDEEQSDGLTLAYKLLSRHPKLRIVGICDREDEQLQKEAISHGIANLITRPIRNRELLALIDQ